MKGRGGGSTATAAAAADDNDNEDSFSRLDLCARRLYSIRTNPDATHPSLCRTATFYVITSIFLLLIGRENTHTERERPDLCLRAIFVSCRCSSR